MQRGRLCDSNSGANRTILGLQEAPQGEEPVFSVDRLPTTIQEEGSFMSDSVIGPDVLTPNRLSEVRIFLSFLSDSFVESLAAHAHTHTHAHT